jgi:hypothetical protein
MVSNEKSSKFIHELLFTKIFQAFRMAIQPTKLVITFCSLAVLCIIGRIMDFAWVLGTTGELSFDRPQGVFSSVWSLSATKFQDAVNSVFAFDILALSDHITVYFTTIGELFKSNSIYCVIFTFAALVVFSIGGGAICRIAALQVAKGEKPGLTFALHYSLKQFTSFLTTPVAPVVIIAILGAFIFIVGLAGNIPRVGELLIGISMPLILFFGMLMTVVIIGTFAGFNLMFPAVAYDGSDCFDAISRSFCYVYDKPWWMLFYTAIAMVYGSICYTFIRYFAFLTLWVTRGSLKLGLWADAGNQEINKLQAIWPEPAFIKMAGETPAVTSNWTEWLAAYLVYVFVLVVIGLVVSFIINFYFSANTIIYALMRYRVDNTPIEDIYTPADEESVYSGAISSPPQNNESRES